MFIVRNKSTNAYVRTWKQVGGSNGHIEVAVCGETEGKRFPTLGTARLFVQMITFNNADHCDIDDLEIVEFAISKRHPPEQSKTDQ